FILNNKYIKQQADIISHYYLVKYHSASEALEILKSSLFNQQAKRESVLGAFLRNPKDKILKSTNWGGYYRPRGIKK
ncbi:hypothetical protein, partial [Neisseria zoodegmatis]|uniref:hypothetical protein n=1 Tax=Neisseria zoodegmatis TaxID=326523 RepID=UPI001B803C16